MTARVILTVAWVGVAITAAILVFGAGGRPFPFHIAFPAIAFPILVAIVVARAKRRWGTLFLGIAAAILGAFTIYSWVFATAIHDPKAGLWVGLVVLGFGAVSIGTFVHIVTVRRANRGESAHVEQSGAKQRQRLRKT